MNFKLIYAPRAAADIQELYANPALQKRRKAVVKALRLMSENIRHPGLQTHEHYVLSRQLGRKVFESYAEQHTPGAYRIFWHYGLGKGEITIMFVTPHP